MAHLSENSRRLAIKTQIITDKSDLQTITPSDVTLIVLPADGQYQNPLINVGKFIFDLARRISNNATLIILGETVDLVAVETSVKNVLTYQLWIALKTLTTKVFPNSLPRNHFGALVYTSYKSSLRHTKTRIEYTFCPACELTTKDYGGKKHTYDPYGTLLSDVWKDIRVDYLSDLTPIFTRLADLFGIDIYSEMQVLDCRNLEWSRQQFTLEIGSRAENQLPEGFQNHLLLGDCVQGLRQIPDNSIDFAFADPPYNLSKKYAGYADDLDIQKYFEWCDEWLGELYRVLKPGRTLAVLNIPLWSVRHFHYLQTRMLFQNWIVWDALSFPVRLIMPAHYTILTFTKGQSRQLPGEISPSIHLNHLIDGYCVREKCVSKRHRESYLDSEPLTDLWSDTHRIKHNSRRVDHPCQLPPKLMYRLISLFTHPGESVLDPFNGAGTTTLTAQQLGRLYVGLELDAKYHNIALARHEEVAQGLDPFRKEERGEIAKNSRVERVKKQKYEVPKKTLQLEVRRIAETIGHIPSREEVIEFGEYPIHYYDDYFLSWGEVTASARNKGMSERKADYRTDEENPIQPSLF